MNDVVRQLDAVFRRTPKTIDFLQDTIKMIDKINRLDTDANYMLSQSGFLIRILSAVRRLGNLFYNRNEVLRNIRSIATSEIDKITEPSRLRQQKIEHEEEKKQNLSRLPYEALLSQLPPSENLRLLLSSEKEKPVSDNDEARRVVRTLGQKIWNDFGKNNRPILEAFNSVKNDPDKFEYFAYLFSANSRYPVRNTCEFLEKIEWPSQELKESVIPKLVPLMIETVDACSISESSIEMPSTSKSISTCRLLLNMKKILGAGDFIVHPKTMSPYLAKGIGLTIQMIGENLPKDKLVGLHVVIGQYVECRFSSSMLSPLLPHLNAIPRLVALELSDIGIRNPWDAPAAQTNNGFGDQDAEPLLSILRTNPHLINFVYNLSMSPDVFEHFNQSRALDHQPRMLIQNSDT